MNRPALLGLLALATACAASGCRSHAITYSSSSSLGYGWSDHRHEPPEPPTVGLSDEQVARALEKQNVRAAKRHEEALDVVAEARGADVGALATAVSDCYALGERELGDQLADGTRGVFTWDRAASVVKVRGHYRSRGPFSGGALEVTVRRRRGIEGPIAIAFPPGTYGVATGDVAADGGDGWTRPDDDRRYGEWPSQQDLALLRAPVLYLGPDDREGSILLPIACASFHSGPPASDQAYELRRFEPGSKIDRLLVTLCRRQRTTEAESQLAVWLARNDISWSDFVAKGGDRGGLVTFGTESHIYPKHASGAARLLVESGVNPRYSAFYADHAEIRPETASPAPETASPGPGATP